jgi:hypothetical protein
MIGEKSFNKNGLPGVRVHVAAFLKGWNKSIN